MLQLEEAGEEDICSLLNEIMGEQRYYGTGTDLSEYLDALSVLEAQGELRVREYSIENGRTRYGDVLVGKDARPLDAFQYDSDSGAWRWKSATRQLVEVT